MNPDSKFFSFMSLIGDLILLNVLFILTSLPILTFGASVSALYLSVKKRIAGEESYVMRDYFHAFRENLKNCLIIWPILLIWLVIMVFFTGFIAGHLNNIPALVVYCLLAFALAFILLYVFPLQATFINTPLRLIINSLLTALRHLPYTLFMFFTAYTPMALTLAFPRMVSLSFVYWCTIGCSLSMVLACFALKKVLAVYLP